MMKKWTFMVMMLLLSSCINNTASKSFKNPNISVQCVSEYLLEIADFDVVESVPGNAVVDFQSTIMSVEYSAGQLKVIAKSNQQKLKEKKKMDALKSGVGELAETINDFCTT